MMPSGPRFVLSLMVALALTLGVLLFAAPHDSKDKFAHSLQPMSHQSP